MISTSWQYFILHEVPFVLLEPNNPTIHKIVYINEGLNTLGHRGINACGDGKVHAFLDSENPKLQVTVNEARTKNMQITA